MRRHQELLANEPSQEGDLTGQPVELLVATRPEEAAYRYRYTPAARAVAAKARRWVLRSLTALLAGSLSLALAGFLWESYVNARVQRQHPMLGQLLDVGGYRLHLYCTGEGSPTVVLDSGFIFNSQQWRFVQPEIAKLTRVCSFDRAGLGWSDPGPLPRTSQRMSEELHTLLRNAGISGPYLLVGHSFAGLNVRLFAAEHPDEVAGVILVDSVHPDHFGGSPPAKREELLFSLLPNVAPFGVARLLGYCPDGPPSCRQFTQTFAAMRDSRGESAREVRVYAPTLGSTPLTVISHDPEFYVAVDSRPERRLREEARLSWQYDLVQLSSNSEFITAKGAGHQIPTDHPALVIGAIQKMLASSRSPGAGRGAGRSRRGWKLPDRALGELFAEGVDSPFGR